LPRNAIKIAENNQGQY